MTHKCIGIVNKRLAKENMELVADLMNPNTIFIDTVPIEKRRGFRAPLVAATYCPFCGDRLEPKKQKRNTQEILEQSSLNIEREKRIAERAVEQLFTNGVGDRSERLVLEGPGGSDLGGWCRGAVRDVVLAAILAEREESHGKRRKKR